MYFIHLLPIIMAMGPQAAVIHEPKRKRFYKNKKARKRAM